MMATTTTKPIDQDLDLMFDNAIKFNPKEHIVHEVVRFACHSFGC